MGLQLPIPNTSSFLAADRHRNFISALKKPMVLQERWEPLKNIFVVSKELRSRRQRDVHSEFVNIEDLPAQFTKKLIEIGFAYVLS